MLCRTTVKLRVVWVSWVTWMVLVTAYDRSTIVVVVIVVEASIVVVIIVIVVIVVGIVVAIEVIVIPVSQTCRSLCFPVSRFNVSLALIYYPFPLSRPKRCLPIRNSFDVRVGQTTDVRVLLTTTKRRPNILFIVTTICVVVDNSVAFRLAFPPVTANPWITLCKRVPNVFWAMRKSARRLVVMRLVDARSVWVIPVNLAPLLGIDGRVFYLWSSGYFCPLSPAIRCWVSVMVPTDFILRLHLFRTFGVVLMFIRVVITNTGVVLCCLRT